MNRPRQPHSAFTLLEVIMGVAILALVVLTIYRFLETNLQAMQISTEVAADNRQLAGLVAVVQDQLEKLPRYEQGALFGEAHIFNDMPADEVTWLCTAGSGLFTRHATGQFKVKLVIRPAPDNPSQYDLGIERTPYDKTQVSSPATTQRIGQKVDWVPLIQNAKALEIRYYDSNLSAWVEKWTDQTRLPVMLRMRVWRAQDVEGFETVLNLPRGQPRVRMPGQQRASPRNSPRNTNPDENRPNGPLDARPRQQGGF
jgi:prepilin-type N-terminal cleavage/methylation domain-containing protein